MFQAMQGGDALEIPAVDVFVTANTGIFQYSMVALRPGAPDVEGDVNSGRVRLRGCALANSIVANDRQSHILGVAQHDGSSGDIVKVRIQGCTELAVLGGAIALGEALVLGGAGYASKTEATSADNTAATQGFRIIAWALEAGTPSGANVTDATRFKVCFNGSGWGSDEYTNPTP